MDNSILVTASNYVKESFRFLYDYGYALSEFNLIDTEECKMVYINQVINKEIYISVYNYDDVQRFFITISISRIPYLSVNDFVSFDVFMTKNKISVPESLTGNQRNIENVNRYIETNTFLFKENFIKLITSQEQFPHNFIEWT